MNRSILTDHQHLEDLGRPEILGIPGSLGNLAVLEYLEYPVHPEILAVLACLDILDDLVDPLDLDDPVDPGSLGNLADPEYPVYLGDLADLLRLGHPELQSNLVDPGSLEVPHYLADQWFLERLALQWLLGILVCLEDQLHLASR